MPLGRYLYSQFGWHLWLPGASCLPGPHATSFTHRTCRTHGQPSEAEMLPPFYTGGSRLLPRATQREPQILSEAWICTTRIVLLHPKLTNPN